MSIDGVKRGRAHQLYTAGYKTVGSVHLFFLNLNFILQIANANYEDLLSKINNLRKFQAIKIVNNARVSYGHVKYINFKLGPHKRST